MTQHTTTKIIPPGGKLAGHIYSVQCSWKGRTGEGYEKYSRAHTVIAPPAIQGLAMSADASFKGEPEKLNPEQLLVMAASSCQMLSFLSIAARARIDIIEYLDAAGGEMPDAEKPMRITKITLRPLIVAGKGSDGKRILEMVELAHKQCFIANSLKSEIVLDPKIEIET